MKRIVFVIGLLLSCNLYAKMVVSNRDQYIKKVEDYFQELTTLESLFTQTNQDGSQYYGRFYMKRPAKFRLDYSEPEFLLVICDGNTVIHHDRIMDDVTYADLSSTPAFIMRENLKLNGDLTVTSLVPSVGQVRLTIVKTEDVGAGSITLIFDESPFTLREWIVLDSQGQRTHVNLSNIKSGHELKPSLFKFRGRY